MNRAQFAELLKNEQAHPIVLMRELTRFYGVEWMRWMMTVLRRTLEKDFDVAPAKINLDKAKAAATVAMQDTFWKKWEHFHFLCQALNNNRPDHQSHKEFSVGQMMVAVDIATTIRKELGKLSYEPTFSDEVARYVAAQAKNAGVWYLPDLLSFAAVHASGKRYRCRDCGNDSEVLYDDGLCDHCIERFDTSRLGSWEPNWELVAKRRGRNIEIYEKNPTARVKARLEKVVASPNITLQENQVDVCVAKLLVALQYVAHRRKQLEEQAT